MNDYDRYQYQSWYVKLWRRRHYLYIPISAIRMWLKSKHKDTFQICWSIAIGLAQQKMKWYYTLEEVMERLDKKSKRYENES